MKNILRFLLLLVSVSLYSCETMDDDYDGDGNEFDVWDGFTAISTIDELKNIQNELDGLFFLTENITLTEDWVPIGTESEQCTSVLDKVALSKHISAVSFVATNQLCFIDDVIIICLRSTGKTNLKLNGF